MKKHYLPVLISTICLLFSTMVFSASAQPKIVVYTLSGGYELVKEEDFAKVIAHADVGFGGRAFPVQGIHALIPEK